MKVMKVPEEVLSEESSGKNVIQELEESLENDEISAEEEGFIIGYEDDEDIEQEEENDIQS